MARDGVRAILFRVRGLWMRHSDARTLGDGALRVDGLSRDPTDADKQEDALHRSNETELSHRWRQRALLRSLILKSYES